MSSASETQMGNDKRASVLPTSTASGPGFLGPDYNPADEMSAPAQIGVKRGDSLESVVGAVKGVVYYTDMIGFGSSSTAFTNGMPGLKPLGVNYFLRTGATCSNGADMWEYVETIPNGSALGSNIQNAIADMGLPQLRGMAPGILEDAKAALDPSPILNAVAGSGYPQCRLMKLPVGDFDGRITNRDGKLLVDPNGLLKTRDGRFFQEQWIQDRIAPPVRRSGETDLAFFLRGKQVQLPYDEWNKQPKNYATNGCLKDPSQGGAQPIFCAKQNTVTQITLPDKSTVNAVGIDGFEDYMVRTSSVNRSDSAKKLISLSVATIALMGLVAFWSVKKN
jgi:hypothetical protein